MKYAHNSRRGFVWLEGSDLVMLVSCRETAGASHLNDLLTCTLAAL